MHFRKMGLGLFAQVNYLHWESALEKLSPIHYLAPWEGQCKGHRTSLQSTPQHTHTSCSTCPSLIQEGQTGPISWGTRKLPKALSYSDSSRASQQLGLGLVRLAHPMHVHRSTRTHLHTLARGRTRQPGMLTKGHMPLPSPPWGRGDKYLRGF